MRIRTEFNSIFQHKHSNFTYIHTLSVYIRRAKIAISIYISIRESYKHLYINLIYDYLYIEQLHIVIDRTGRKMAHSHVGKYARKKYRN